MQSDILADIGKSVIAAGAIGFPAYILKIPLILAYIAAGIIIGPHIGLGIIKDFDSISKISEIGLVLLMFILGLEINLKKLLETGRTVLLTGAVQIIGSALLAFLFFYFVIYKSFTYELIYISVALTLSSTLIVVKILSDQMDLDSLPSRITLGILVLQDLFAVAFLAIQPNLSNISFVAILVSLARVALLIFVSWAMAKNILPHLFKIASKHSELLLILAMAWCFSMCGFANYLSLSLEMGALIAGISIASFPYHLDVAAKIVSLRDFFITLFFVSLGLQIPVPSAKVIELAALFSAFVIVSRMLTIFPVLYKLGYANRASLLPSINLSQISEFSLVFASIGLTYNHVSKDLLIGFIIAMIFTSLLSSFMIPGAHKIYQLINPYLIKIGLKDDLIFQNESAEIIETKSIVFLGFYRDASSLLYEMLNKFSSDIVTKLRVIDFNPEAHYELKKMNIRCQFGDISSLDNLKQSNLENAEMLICSIPDKALKGTTNLKLLQLLKKLVPDSKIIVTAENIDSAREMYALGATYVYIPRIIGATALLETIEQIYINGDETITESSSSKLADRKEVLP